MATLQDFKTSEKSWWCPGCGDFGVLAALGKALVGVGADPDTTAIVAGIGCSGKIGNYINSYNIHVTHGRTLPAALGIKLANRSLRVLAVGGDGDAYAIGMGHFMHALRRNADITYIVMDNHVYGLTKGQTSPTSQEGFHTKTSPEGSIERPVHPLMLAVAGGASFVAQGFSSWQPQLARLIMEGMNHPGFALINVISPCVTYNRVNSYDWYKKSLANLDDEEDYDRTSRAKALARLEASDELVAGLVFQEPSVPYEDQIPGFLTSPLTEQNPHIDPEVWNKILQQFD